jgi:AcrR family transcriptional regulator
MNVVMTPFSSVAQKKQSKIVEVATELFLERGYDAVSLDDILERVGGSKSTLYSYYGGKEGLFAAIVHQNCERVLAPLMELDVMHMEPRNGLSEIGRVFLLLVSDCRGQAFYRMMIAESTRFPQLASEFYSAGPEVTRKLIQRNLEHWQKKRLLRSGNCEMFAVQFIGMLLGNFSVKSILGLTSDLSEQAIKDWVAGAVTVFLEGAQVRS